MITLESSENDALSCGIIYNHHSDNSRGVMFLENIYSTGITHDAANMFILQAWLNELGQT
jgi:hypothetical protein